MRLTGIGEVKGTAAGEIKAGDKLVFNYGSIETVEKVVFSKTGKTLVATVKVESGELYERKLRATTEVCILGEVKEEVEEETIEKEAEKSEAKIYSLEKIFVPKKYTGSFRGTSFDPEKRAESFAAGAITTMTELFNETIKLDPSRKKEIENQFNNIVEKYKIKIDDLAGSKGRVLSPMITGPANFPVDKNNKKIEIVMKKNEDIKNWIQKVEKNLIKKYTKKTPITDKITEEVKDYHRLGLGNVGLKGRLLTIARNGAAKEVKEAISDYKIFTKRNKIHKIIENLIQIQEQGNKEFIINENLKVVDDLEASRIKVFFNYKPDEEVRGHLRSKAYKWSPKNKCWQNYRRPDRLKEIIEYLSKED